MPDHHHPESRRPEPPSPKQQRYLRVLAQRTGTTFAVPKSKAEASAEIRRLERLSSTPHADRRREALQTSCALSAGATAARVREDETTTTGYGATARWA